MLCQMKDNFLLFPNLSTDLTKSFWFGVNHGQNAPERLHFMLYSNTGASWNRMLARGCFSEVPGFQFFS